MTSERPRAIVIGTSAGAVGALSQILPALPADFPLPVFVVVHVPRDRESMLTPLLQAKCQMAVREAADKEAISGGVIYLAPPNYHLLVEEDGVLSLSSDEEVWYSRPSIDVLFESAADAYGAALIGVILTGANPDGARGLKAIAQRGGTVFVEDPETAHAAAMPLAALSACPAARIGTLKEIASYIMKECNV